MSAFHPCSHASLQLAPNGISHSDGQSPSLSFPSESRLTLFLGDPRIPLRVVVVFPKLVVGSVEASRSVQAPCSVVLAASVNIRIAVLR